LIKSVQISLHDVTPAFEPECRAAVSLCRSRGLRPALLVVPNFHHLWPLGSFPDFCAWIRSLQADNHPVWLHGFHHLSSIGQGRRGPFGTIGNIWQQRIVSQGEAEFAGISRPQARERIDRGISVLRNLGIRPSGFVPPAWLMPAWLPSLLAAEGLEHTEDHLSVYSLKHACRRFSLVLNHASRTPARRVLTRWFCRASLVVARRVPTRIALHPADFRHQDLIEANRRLIDWAAQQHR